MNKIRFAEDKEDFKFPSLIILKLIVGQIKDGGKVSEELLEIAGKAIVAADERLQYFSDRASEEKRHIDTKREIMKEISKLDLS